MTERAAPETTRRHPNRGKLATGFAIAVAAIGAFPATALARHNVHRTPSKLTQAEKKLNRRAQFAVNNLVHTVVDGPVAIKGVAGPLLLVYPNGQPSIELTEFVSAPNLYGSGQGEYSFSVLAPITPKGRPSKNSMQLNRAESIVLSEGEITTPVYSLTPYVTLALERNQQTGGAWAVKGNYQSPKTDSPYVIEAAVKPQMPHEAPLTDMRLNAFIGQAYQLVGEALQRQAVGDQKAAFFQPPGTQINPLK
ncbi:MAG TPA: hypothetical protein VNG32_02510 [Candidatus Dormibacteraeota bacterium]|nr:hypothetical protein [Candidatus Dormibacteraeota bacterium]